MSKEILELLAERLVLAAEVAVELLSPLRRALPGGKLAGKVPGKPGDRRSGRAQDLVAGQAAYRPPSHRLASAPRPGGVPASHTWRDPVPCLRAGPIAPGIAARALPGPHAARWLAHCQAAPAAS